MFEMLGNWSFGDYFKRSLALGLGILDRGVKWKDPCMFLFLKEEGECSFRSRSFWYLETVCFRGSHNLGNKKIILEMGDQGPCGPCSEIHIDLRTAEEKVFQVISSCADHPQVVEFGTTYLWNSTVKMVLWKTTSTTDTGMGFERLCMAMQNVTSNYDTDVFTPLIEK
jgi:alanyl-tRNA synthetase